MIILPDTLLQIVVSGGGVIIDLKKQVMLPDTLRQLAHAASISGGWVVIKLSDSVMMPDLMRELALHGKGHVIFDLS